MQHFQISHAYQQIFRDEQSKKYVTVNTHGLTSRGTHSLSKDNVKPLERTTPFAVYLDDILVSGADEADHLRNLDEVLCKLEETEKKCAFTQKEVEYLGHKVDAQGLHPVEDKVKAFMKLRHD